MKSMKNIARVAGLLYVLIEIFGFSSTLYVPTNSSHAATVWLAIRSIMEGFVARAEIVGGLWVLLITWGALHAGRLPKRLNYLGVLIGVAGILTVVPALEVLGNGFRLGEIVWSLWLGIVMFRSSPSAVARKCRVFLGGSDVVCLEGGRRFSATQRGHP